MSMDFENDDFYFDKAKLSVLDVFAYLYPRMHYNKSRIPILDTKILGYLQFAYYGQTKRPLFRESIFALPNGLVIPKWREQINKFEKTSEGYYRLKDGCEVGDASRVTSDMRNAIREAKELMIGAHTVVNRIIKYIDKNFPKRTDRITHMDLSLMDNF